MNCFMSLQESKDFSLASKLARKVPGDVIADKRTRGPPSSLNIIKKSPVGDFLLFNFFVFSINFAPFAILFKLDLFSDEFFVLA